MAIENVICVNCRKEFPIDTEGKIGETYRSINTSKTPKSSRIILERCKHCGHLNRIEVPNSEV